MRHTEAGELLTEVVVTVFALNARLLEVAQELAVTGGLTAAWWQVLGGVIDQPRSVAGIGRRMGMTRQGVQRVANLLVEHGLAEYRANPAHRRAKLLACTEAGHRAIRQIAVQQRPWAARIGAVIGADELRHVLATLRNLTAELDADQGASGAAVPHPRRMSTKGTGTASRRLAPHTHTPSGTLR